MCTVEKKSTPNNSATSHPTKYATGINRQLIAPTFKCYACIKVWGASVYI